MNMKKNVIRGSLDSLIITDKKPAKTWEEAYPIGNGSKGAMIFGGTDKETICLNDDTLWSGYPMDVFKGEGLVSLDRAKSMLREGKYVEADKEISNNFTCYATQAYMPIGNLMIDFISANGNFHKYKRSLNLENAVYSSEYIREDVQYKSVAFASYPANAIVYRIEATKNGEDANCLFVQVRFESSLYSKTYTDGNVLCLEGECPVTANQNILITDRKTLYFDEPEKRGMRFVARAEVKTDGTIVNKYNHNILKIDAATYIEIRITDATSFNGYQKHPFVEGKDYREECRKLQQAISSMDYSQLLQDHIKDYTSYFNRVTIDLGSDRRSKLPTAERLLHYAKGQSDKALLALLFNFGHYLTISASRTNSEPMNLQGIWNRHFSAPWHSNYTLNINAEMNYFPTLAVNLTEMYQPFLHMIEELSKAGEETAKRLYGADGWCCHHNTDLWRHTAPVCGDALYSFWNASGGWLCNHLMEYYEYTLDKEYLKEKVYPIMQGAVKFYLSQLKTQDGYRIIFPSTSPENLFVCESGESSVSETTEMTMAIVRELFKNYVKVCEILGENDDVLKQVKNEIPLLMPTKIGTDGRILEWYGEQKEKSIHHRHISHLYSLHPGHAITPEGTPELFEACKKVLAVRGDGGTGWSLAWKSNCYARLRDGDHVLKLLNLQLAPQEPIYSIRMNGGGTYPNLFCAHPPFQIDGNFGMLNAIAEMFLQSDTDTIHIIPALPSDFKNVAIKGLRAKGNRTVSIKVHDGQLVYCKIQGTLPQKIMANGKDVTQRFTPVSNGWVMTVT